jgi:Ca2+-binding EF-hand superfamily protein
LAKSLGLLESPSINTDSSDFDKSSVEKSERTMNARESIRDAEAMMSSDGDVKLAKHLFESALECEPSNMKARIGLRQANGKIEKELTIQRDYDKRARKLELIKQKHGDNWRDAVVSEPPQTPEELMSVFNLIDADNSGLLDRDEITSLADYLSEDPMSEAEMDQAMQEMDGDGSGEVDFEEFQSWWDARRTSRETAAAKELEPVAAKPNAGVHDEDFDAACLQIFKRYDDDGSGEIDASGLGRILETLGQPMEGGISDGGCAAITPPPRLALYTSGR